MNKIALNNISAYILFSVIIVLLLVMLYNFIFTLIKFKKAVNSVPDTIEEEPSRETKAENAVVISKRIGGHYEGSHTQPAYISDYYITFLTDSQNEIEYSVFEEAYEKAIVGQRGTLITIDGEFFDFGNGEEIIE